MWEKDPGSRHPCLTLFLLLSVEVINGQNLKVAPCLFPFGLSPSLAAVVRLAMIERCGPSSWECHWQLVLSGLSFANRPAKEDHLGQVFAPLRVTASDKGQCRGIKARPSHPLQTPPRVESLSMGPAQPCFLPLLKDPAPQLGSCTPIPESRSASRGTPPAAVMTRYPFIACWFLLIDILLGGFASMFMFEFGLEFSFLVKQLLGESHQQYF